MSLQSFGCCPWTEAARTSSIMGNKRCTYAHMHMHVHTVYCIRLLVLITRCTFLCLLQLLLSYSSTDSNLEGDLGNTPVILACSINNCQALNILVCTKFWNMFLTLYVSHQMFKELFLKLPFPWWQICPWQSFVSVCPPAHPSSRLSKLKHGAMLCHQNKLGHFPIHAAAFAGAKKAMEVILKAGTMKGMIYHQKGKSADIIEKVFTRPNCTLGW